VLRLPRHPQKAETCQTGEGRDFGPAPIAYSDGGDLIGILPFPLHTGHG
jgi:hypothetical protein